jgi:hypothetical protein
MLMPFRDMPFACHEQQLHTLVQLLQQAAGAAE